jgi:CO dehydrogenase/acetyl-CoA synthase epsilon subunit
MRRTNWKMIEKAAKDMRRKVKNITSASDYLKDRPGEGMFRDNISKNLVVIKDCKSSSLRRYLKVVDNFYFLVTSPEDRGYLLQKKVEIEKELNTREDGVIEKE